jgi:hypothetical protein
MQELSNSIKRPNLRIMGIEEGEEVQAKGIHNIFDKIITENFPNLETILPTQVQKASRTPNRLDQNRTSPWHIITKTSIENRKNIEGCKRQKTNNIYKGKPIKITADFSMETLKQEEQGVKYFGHRMKITSTPGYSTQQNYHPKQMEQ